MASLVLGNIGSSLLGPLGGFLGSALGSFIDNLLFAPKPPDIEGPRVEDKTAVQADPGVAIPLVFGADRLPGIVVHTTNLIETKHKKKVGGKGGGKRQLQITYTYHVDINYMLCEGPILGFARVWADGKLVRGTRYQMSLDTDENFEQIGGIPYSTWYKDQVYTPEETPWSYDPTYTPTIEDQKYRWTNDGGFQEITDEQATQLLEDTNEVVYHFDTGSQRMLPIPLSHDYTGEVFDVSTGPPEFGVKSSTPPGVNMNGFGSGNPEDGQSFTQTIYVNIPGEYDGADTPIVGSATGSIVVTGENTPLGGDEVSWGIFGSISMTAYIDDGNGNFVSLPGGTNVDSGFGGTGSVTTFSAQVDLHAGTKYIEVTVSGARTSPALSNATVGGENFLATWTVNPEGDELRDWPDYYNFYDAINDFSPKAVLEFHGPEGVALYRGLGDQISDPTMELVAQSQGITCGVPAYRHRAHVVFQRLELADFGNRIPNLTFEVVQSDDARIVPVLTDLMSRAGIDPEYYDLSELPDAGIPSYILGYTIGKVTSYRAAMEPLLEAFNVDAAEIGNKIVFREKRRSYDHVIQYSDLAAVDTGSGPEAPVRLTFRDVVEMPKSLDVRYKDPEREYQVNTARFARQIGRSTQSSVLELPAVLSPTLMKTYVRDKMRDLWLERSSGAWTLPHKYVYISPSDICLINGEDYGEENQVFKVTKVTRRDTGILEMEGVLRDTEIYVPVEGETDDVGVDRNFVPQVRPSFSSRNFMRFLDIPPLRPDDNDAGFYFAMTGEGFSWPGGVIYRNEGSTIFPRYEEWESISIGARAGYTKFDALLPIEDYLAIDRESEVRVYLYNQDESLESITGEDLLNGGNAALIGGEIVCFQNAEATDDGGFKLTNFLRARRGTDSAVAGHSTAEDFILLTPNELNRRSQTVEQINTLVNGTVNQFKGVTFGYTLGDQPVTDFYNRGRALQPFAPVMVTLRLQGNGDIIFEWVRQDRLAFGFYTNDFPLSEDAEEYELTIGGNEESTSPIRRVTITDATTYTYTAADQATDNFDTIDFDYAIAQVSAQTGYGAGFRGQYNHGD